MMIKKLTLVFVGGPRGQKPQIAGVVWGSSYFSSSL